MIENNNLFSWYISLNICTAVSLFREKGQDHKIKIKNLLLPFRGFYNPQVDLAKFMSM